MIEVFDEDIDLMTKRVKELENEKPKIDAKNNKILDFKSLVTPDRQHVLAYRFYLAKGTYDIRRDVAIQYGINIAPKKGVQLYERKGVIATKNEFNTHKFIEDVSNCPKDIQMIIMMLQSYYLEG